MVKKDRARILRELVVFRLMKCQIKMGYLVTNLVLLNVVVFSTK